MAFMEKNNSRKASGEAYLQRWDDLSVCSLISGLELFHKMHKETTDEDPYFIDEVAV